MNTESQGEHFLKEARACKSKRSGLFGLFASGDKTEAAIKLYEKAGNAFKIEKKWDEAGCAFTKASELNQTNKSQHETASNLVEAANCYRKVNCSKALCSLVQAINIYTDMGRFSIAAKHHLTAGEICEGEGFNLETAMQHYERASDFYRGEEATSSANKCSVKVAHIAAMLSMYEKAADIFLQVGRSSMENKLLVYGAKDHFFKAAMCQLVIDVTNGKRAVEQYESIFPTFSETRECKLLKTLIGAIEEENDDEYGRALKEFDNICRLEAWSTTLFLKIKKSSFAVEVDLS